MLKRFWWIALILVSWKIETCRIWGSNPGKIYKTAYGEDISLSGAACEVSIVEKRKFFKTSDKAIDFINHAPMSATDFKIQRIDEDHK